VRRNDTGEEIDLTRYASPVSQMEDLPWEDEMEEGIIGEREELIAEDI
jgi:hypothetical protein